MMQVVVKNLSQAMRIVKELTVACKEEWSDEYRKIGRQAIGEFLAGRMKESITDHLSRLPTHRDVFLIENLL